MTTDYARGLEDAATAVEDIDIEHRPDEWRGALDAAILAIRSLAPAQGVKRCPICKQPESHHLTVWAKGNPGRECPVDPRDTTPPLVHVDDGQGFRAGEAAGCPTCDGTDIHDCNEHGCPTQGIPCIRCKGTGKARGS